MKATGTSAGILAAIILLVLWRFEFCAGEPTIEGKTVTQWLDQLALSDVVRVEDGTASQMRSANQITNSPAYAALTKLGARAVPALKQTILDRPQWGTTQEGRRERSRAVDEWSRSWLHFKPAPFPTPSTFSNTQRDRKDAAAFMLIALGTNAQGGYLSYINLYSTAPKFPVTGPPVGISPTVVSSAASRALPSQRREIIEGIGQGLTHSNPICRQLAIMDTLQFPEASPQWKDKLVALKRDSDATVQRQAQFVISVQESAQLH